MNEIAATRTRKRCAVYCRVSSDERLDQSFNSIDAQKEAGHAFIKSQSHEGWIAVDDDYDDGGFSGGNMDRPALKRLMADIQMGKVDIVVVYKIDRLSRSLADFARMVDVFDHHRVSFSAVTQQINSATSMGRLMLNVLLSFAQFEREIISERTRDKIAATRRKGKWCGGLPPLGYDVVDTKLVLNQAEAEQVRHDALATQTVADGQRDAKNDDADPQHSFVDAAEQPHTQEVADHGAGAEFVDRPIVEAETDGDTWYPRRLRRLRIVGGVADIGRPPAAAARE